MNTRFHVYRPTPLAQMAPLPDVPDRGTLSELLVLAAVLPEQFYSSSDSAYQAKACREVALMRAVLEDALDCFHKQFLSGRQQDQRLGREAHEWLFAEETHWLFSFVNICTVLGLDPQSIRLELRRWCQSPPTQRWRKRRHTTLRRRRVPIAA